MTAFCPDCRRGVKVNVGYAATTGEYVLWAACSCGWTSDAVTWPDRRSQRLGGNVIPFPRRRVAES